MATLVSETPEVEEHYVTQVALTAALLAALRRLWPAVEPMEAPANLASYAEGVAALVDQFSLASMSMSADYYDDVRARAGITAPLRIPMQPTPPRSLVDAGIDWAMKAKAEMADVEAAIQKRVEAAMQKAVMDAGREQVIASVEGDEFAMGFRRVARPGACAWCLALATRKSTRKGMASEWLTPSGAPKSTRGNVPGHDADAEHWGVYKSRAAAGARPEGAEELNRFHNGCQCVIEPIFDLSFTPPAWLADMDALYADSDDFNHFRRSVEAIRRGDEPAPGKTSTPAAPGPDTTRLMLADLDAVMRQLGAQ